jgi:hypothetical protein
MSGYIFEVTLATRENIRTLMKSKTLNDEAAFRLDLIRLALPIMYLAFMAGMMIFSASLVPAHRSLAGQVIGALLGFVVAAFPLLLTTLVKAGHGRFAARMVAVATIYAALAALVWVKCPSCRPGESHLSILKPGPVSPDARGGR